MTSPPSSDWSTSARPKHSALPWPKSENCWSCRSLRLRVVTTFASELTDDAGLAAEVSKLRHRFVGGPKRVGQEPEVDQRCLNAVALLVRRATDGVPHHRHLETVFEQVTQVGLDADIPGG